MGRRAKVDSSELVRLAERELREGETLVGVLPALAPRDRDRTFMPAEFMLIAIGLDWFRGPRQDRRVTRQSIFPIAPRMFLGLTERRLLIWSAKRGWQVDQFLGHVTLDRIVHAEAPTVGHGWRTLRVYFANEPAVTVKVPGTLADDVAAALSRSTHRGTPDE